VELRHLRYFVAVAEECHFGRAAARLNMAQPPLSQQIRQLESELGVQLLVRSTRKVELTPAGRRYLERATLILGAVQEAGDEVLRIDAGLLGRVAIGFTGSATYELLPNLARSLRVDLPDIDLDLKGEMLTPSQVDALLNHRLDVALLRPPVRNPDLVVQTLRREPLIAVLPETHLLAVEPAIMLSDLQRDPFISYPSHHRSVVYDAVFDACQRAGFTPAVVQEVGETSTLVSFVAAGLGVALVPASVQHLRITGATYRPLLDSTSEVELAIAHRRDEAGTHVLRVLTRIREVLGESTRDSAFATGEQIETS